HHPARPLHGPRQRPRPRGAAQRRSAHGDSPRARAAASSRSCTGPRRQLGAPRSGTAMRNAAHSSAELQAMAVPAPASDSVLSRFRLGRPGLSLRRNISWAFAGNSAIAASQWMLVVLLTKLGGLAMVGQYALASAIAVPVMVFANMNLRGILVTEARA